MHAWYSKRASELFGTVFWTTSTGSEIELTQVTENKDGYYNWPDREYRGEVVKYKRQGMTPIDFFSKYIQQMHLKEFEKRLDLE